MQKFFLVLAVGIFGFVLGRWSHAPQPAMPPAAQEAAKETPAPVIAVAPRVPTGRGQGSESPERATDAARVEATPETAVPMGTEAVEKTEAAPPKEPFGGLPDSPPPPLPGLSELPSAIAEKLTQQRRPNLTRKLASSAPATAMTPSIKGMMGKFEGDIIIDEASNKTWQISMQTDGAISNGALVGSSLVKLARNGRVFSTNSSSGQLKNIRTLGDAKTTFLLELSPAYYLEAFYDPATDSLYGNFYGKNSTGGYGFQGYAVLTRQ